MRLLIAGRLRRLLALDISMTFFFSSFPSVCLSVCLSFFPSSLPFLARSLVVVAVVRILLRSRSSFVLFRFVFVETQNGRRQHDGRRKEQKNVSFRFCSFVLFFFLRFALATSRRNGKNDTRSLPPRPILIGDRQKAQSHWLAAQQPKTR